MLAVVIVALADTNIDIEHPDIAPNVWTNAGEIAGNGKDDDGNGYVDDVHGWNFGRNSNRPQDGGRVCCGGCGSHGSPRPSCSGWPRAASAASSTRPPARPSAAETGRGHRPANTPDGPPPSCARKPTSRLRTPPRAAAPGRQATPRGRNWTLIRPPTAARVLGIAWSQVRWQLPPITIMLLRVGLGAVPLLAALAVGGQRLPGSARIWGMFVTLGLLNNALPFVLYGYAQLRIESGLASILNATTPLWGVLVAHVFTRDEKATRGRIAGVLLQAAEQGMGVALARELIAGDALLDGRLVRVAAQALDLDAGRDYHVVYPEGLRGDPAVRAFCDWLHAEVAALQQRLRETTAADR